MEPQSWLCRACLLLLAFTTSVIQGKVRVVDNKGMKVFVLDEGAYSNLQYFLEELDLKRNQLYAAFPGSPKSALRNENLVELEDRVPVVIGIPKRSASSPSSGSGAEQEISVVPESGGDQMMQQGEPEKLVSNRRSDEWLKNPTSQSYSPSSPAAASAASAGSNYAGHQQSSSSYYSGLPADDSSAVSSSASTDSQSYYEPDRYSGSEYAGDLRSESTTSIVQSKPDSPVRSLIRRWSRN